MAVQSSAASAMQFDVALFRSLSHVAAPQRQLEVVDRRWHFFLDVLLCSLIRSDVVVVALNVVSPFLFTLPPAASTFEPDVPRKKRNGSK